MAVNALVRRLPLLGKDHVVLLYGVLDDIGRSQYLLSVLLGIHLNPMDLGSVGSPFHLCIVHLQELELVGYQASLLPLLLPRIQASLSWVGNGA